MWQGNIKTLICQFPVDGELVWIGIRPGRKEVMRSVDEVFVDCQQGLLDDHYAGRSKQRQVTLFQWEYLRVIESLMGMKVTPALLRRNLLVRGVNLMALNKQVFQIGHAIFTTTGLCQPCSRMEAVLGCGGYNAMRSHGGITAQVLQSGKIKTGDALTVLQQE